MHTKTNPIFKGTLAIREINGRNGAFKVGTTEEITMQHSTPFVLHEDTGCYQATRELSPAEILDMASFIAMQSFNPGKSISNASDSISTIWHWIGKRKNEVFIALFLDNKHRVIRVEELFYGTIDAASVHPRVVVQKALEYNAAAVIFGHNHPSGVTNASQSDKNLTDKLKQALTLIDVRILDHIIVGPDENTRMSFAEKGLI